MQFGCVCLCVGGSTSVLPPFCFHHQLGLLCDALLSPREQRASDIEHIDEVSKLCAATGYVHGGPGGKGGRVPEDYPELLFARHTFDPSIVAMIIGRLRADDIYNQVHPASVFVLFVFILVLEIRAVH